MPYYQGPQNTGGDISSDDLFDAKGDLAIGSADNAAGILTVGTDGQALIADSGEALGVKWASLGGGGDALQASPLSQFAATTSAQLAGVISDETGSGALVFGTAPSIAGATLTGVIDAGGAGSFELPNSATPTVNADGEIALDTSVSDFSHGILKYYGGEEMAIVAVPVGELSSPTGGHVVGYNATNDEFELVAQSASGLTIGDSITSGTANRLLYEDGSNQLASSSGVQYDGTDLTVDSLIVSSTLKVPFGAAPTISADGDFAIDTTITDFSHGLIKYYDGEELAVVAMPIAEFSSPTDGYVVAYNATNDEFELVVNSGS